MGSKTDAGMVAGVFADEEHAAEAVKQLIEAHYDPRHEINVIASHHREHENVPIREDFKFFRNGVIGAALGAVIVGVGVAITGGTVGLFTMIAAGPLAAALEGALIGGVIGFAIGALETLEGLKQKPAFESAHVHDGVVMVGVQAKGERGSRARQILKLAGARHFTS